MITLPPELEQIVKDRVKTGQYPTPEAVLGDALSLLSDRDNQVTEFTPEHEAYIRRCLAEAEDDVQNGRVITVDEQGLRDLCEDAIVQARRRTATHTQS